MLEKISELKALKEEKGYGYLIEVDGSCNERTFGDLAKAGTQVFIPWAHPDFLTWTRTWKPPGIR